jgi:hypothetical protein
MTDTEKVNLIQEQCAAYNCELQAQGAEARFACQRYYDYDNRDSLVITYNDGKSYHVWNATGVDFMTGFHVLRAFWSGMNLQRDFKPLPDRESR